MQKKFFDIIPPKAREEKSVEIPVKRNPKRSLASQKSLAPLKEAEKKRPKRKRRFKKGLIAAVIILILILTTSLFLPNDVEIEVWPAVEKISFTETVVIDLNTTEVDLENNIIPGQIINNEKIGFQEFSSTGRTMDKSKAKGTITVYNAYSTSSRSLIPSRFVSADGKLFWSTKKITLPGAHYKDGNLIPGEKEIQIIATEPGPDYNISATTFALPALAGTALYTTIYAKSFSPMAGGYEGKVSQITQDDLDNAENILTEKLKAESASQLKESLEDNFILPSETIVYSVSDIKSSQLVGAKVDSFNLDMKVISTGLAFKGSDIDSFVEAKIGSNIKEDYIIQEGTLAINYVLEEMDLEIGKMIIQLEISAKIHTNINLEELKKVVMGKSIKEAEIFLNSLSAIDRIKINMGLSLKRRIPENMGNIKVLLILD